MPCREFKVLLFLFLAVSLTNCSIIGDYGCFSTDTWVTTPNGKKRMDSLQVGDIVLTANLTETFFAPVTLWIHREPEVTTSFTTIMTEYGKMLAVTSKHLMLRNKCDEDYADFIDSVPADTQAVFADELSKGDCMILLYKGKFRQQRLQEITTTQRKGLFAPLTSNGRIIVNDMLASCFSDINEPEMQSTYFSAMAGLRERVDYLIGSMGTSVIEAPIFTSLSKELLRLAIPYFK